MAEPDTLLYKILSGLHATDKAITGKFQTAISIPSGHLAIGGADGKGITDSNYTIDTSESTLTDATGLVATSKGAKGYVDNKTASMVTAGAVFAANDIIVGNAADRTVKKSGFTIGAATSGSFGTATEVAVESAVSAWVTSKLTGYSLTSHSHANMVTGSSLTSGKVIIGSNNSAIKVSSYEIGSESTVGSTSGKIATEKGVKTYVDALVGTPLSGVDATYPLSATAVSNRKQTLSLQYDSTLKVASNKLATNLEIKKLATADSGYAATYQLQIAGGTAAIGDKINIIKDQFLKNVELVAEPDATDIANGAVSGQKCLRFTFELDKSAAGDTAGDSDRIVCVSVADLCDVYTGVSGITVNASNQISPVIKSGESILKTGADGLYISMPTKYVTATTAMSAADYIVITTATSNNVKASSYKIATSVSNSSTTIPTNAAVYAAVSGKQDSSTAVTATNAFATDNTIPLVDGTSSRKLKGSSYTVLSAGTTAAASIDMTSDTKLPTAKAISGYVTNKLTGYSPTSHTHTNMVTGSDLTANQIVLGSGSSAVKISSYTIANDKISSSAKSTTVVPTQEAVYGAISGFVTGSSLTADKIAFGNGGSAIKISSYSIANTKVSSSAKSTTIIPTQEAVYGAISGLAASDHTHAGMVTSDGTGTTSGKIVVTTGTNNKIISGTIDASSILTSTGTGTTANRLVVTTGTANALVSSSIATSNLVQNSTGDASAAEKVIVSAGANKTVKATTYGIATDAILDVNSSDASPAGNANKIATYDAVAKYVSSGLNALLTDIESMIAALA